MASPAPLATAKPPPLSYAERAKKAPQNVKSSPQVASQRSISQGAPPSVAHSVSSTAALRPAGAAAPTSPPSVSNPAPPGHQAADARAPSTPSHPAAVSSSKSTTPPTTEPLAEPGSNGDVNRNGDSQSSAPSASLAPKQASAPPVNVWNVRKEKMAARTLPPSRSVESTSLPRRNPAASTTQTVTPEASTLFASSSNPSVAPQMKISQSAPALNGRLAPLADDDDLFVVRPGRSPPNPSSSNTTPPAIDDTESWPEVGQAAATPPHASNGRAEGKTKGGDEERGHEREASQGHGSRKSEKTKWVPIPPEDLQFERPSRPQQPKTRHQHADRPSRQSGGPSGAASTSSGQGSQQQSRTHSSAGMRPPPSHAGSVSHSQAQSRTGSVHSSPRHSSVRGSGKRLPDEPAPGIGVSRSMRSSGPSSPAMFAQPQPLPPQEFIPGIRPFVNTNLGQPGRELLSLSAIPDSGTADVPPPGTFYSPVPPLGVSPYHSPRPAGSPANNPYALPPMGYPGQQGITAPVPVPGYGTPPYPMYPPPYPYGYGQSYMYWAPPSAQMPPGVSVPSPMVHPMQSSDAGIPPPTMMARPPPPNESEALAGYREVGITLPTVAAPSQSQPTEDAEHVPRTRELSFGTIAAAGANTPSPAPGSPSVGAISTGVALGLDVGEGQASVSGVGELRKAGEVAVVDGGEKTDGKTFAVFSIGIGPGEPGPARLRSRTRTQSKSAVISVSGLAETSDKEEKEEGAAAGTDVDVLADVAAAVIDLTDKGTKWEFGTTKQSEQGGSSGDVAIAPPSTVGVPGIDSSTLPQHVPGTSFVPGPAPYVGAPPFVPSVVIPGGPINGIPPAPSPSAYTPRHPAPEHDEWEVRNYGFGRGGPPPPSAYSPREDRFRDRPDFQPPRDHHAGRPRRGSYNQGGFERGGFAGRRGRGLSGGYGGRGYANRSFSGGRGGYVNQGQHRQPPYVPPPPPPPPDATTYYVPPMAPLPPYVPAPYDPYAFAPFPPPPPPPQAGVPQGSVPPPLPVPQSALPYSLDSTRYYLLGQLEYYLSSQNMVQDFFLRKQMDSRGWIPIQLIASFNRVRSLTTDAHLVAEVLALSMLVEVHDGYVRMRQWRQFVLPTAPKSIVEPDDVAQPTQETTAPTGEEGATHPEEHQETLQNHEGDEEEEEDVEFVL
ncbi:hypothetical protein C8Q78DRAFT_989386 [Trametes maxima]|nr:hypothetical protein C8Q78DRAFT_989386 [Trametes maxima]